MAVEPALRAPLREKDAQMCIADKLAIDRGDGTSGDAGGRAAIDREHDVLDAGIGHVLGAATASRMEDSASCRLVMVPMRTPLLSRKAAPRTCSLPCSARPIRHTVFDVPTSSTATRPGR